MHACFFCVWFVVLADGVDTRIRGLKLVPGAGQVSGLSQSMFDNADFSRYVLTGNRNDVR